MGSEQRLSLTIYVPTRNEEQNIGAILREIKQRVRTPHRLLVVDGHSTDRTREVAAEMEAEVLLDSGGGKGVALRDAIEHCDTDVLLFMDADGSHDVGDIDALVKPIFDGSLDLVIGSRSRGGSDELHGDIAKWIRIVGSDIITLGINYRFDVRLTDSQNGFRALRTELGRRMQLKERITTIEQEMLIKALHLGARVGEIPSHEYSRRSGESCINVRRVWFRYVYSWLKNLFFPDFRPLPASGKRARLLPQPRVSS